MRVKVKSRACIMITELTNGQIDMASLETTSVHHSEDESAPTANFFADSMVEIFRSIYNAKCKRPNEPLFNEEVEDGR